MEKILFVCTANICRSPMAAGIFDALAEERGLEFASASAGVAALVDEPAAPHAQRAMDEMGIDIGGHRARQTEEALVREADLVLTMTPDPRDTLRRNFEGHREKIKTLPEYATGDVDGGIADPYGFDLGAYRYCARQLLDYVERVLERLQSERTS